MVRYPLVFDPSHEVWMKNGSVVRTFPYTRHLRSGNGGVSLLAWEAEAQRCVNSAPHRPNRQSGPRHDAGVSVEPTSNPLPMGNIPSCGNTGVQVGLFDIEMRIHSPVGR